MSLLGVALALGSALSWGAADFAGGLLSRRAPALAVTIVAQGCGMPLALALAVATGEPVPSPLTFAWAALGGLTGGIGIAGLYRALSEGQMTRVAPVAGLIAAGVPVLLGLALGDRLDAPRAAGILVALLAIVAVARHDATPDADRGRSRRVLVIAAVAGLGLGLNYVAFDRAAAVDGATWWILVASRTTASLVLLVAAAAVRQPGWPGRAMLPTLVLVGAADLGGTGFFLLANALGPLGPTAVLSALYPVVTALLALIVLRERLARLQVAGIGLAAVGVLLLAWP